MILRSSAQYTVLCGIEEATMKWTKSKKMKIVHHSCNNTENFIWLYELHSSVSIWFALQLIQERAYAKITIAYVYFENPKHV